VAVGTGGSARERPNPAAYSSPTTRRSTRRTIR
jgi:hypothetical protein